MKSDSAKPKPSDCPRCATPLVAIEREGARGEVCSDGCRGLRVGRGVLDKLARAEVEAPVEERFTGTAVSELSCTRCNAPMQAARIESVVVDRCPACGAWWLDRRELEQIRKDLADAERRRLHNPHWAWNFFDPFDALLLLLDW